MTLGLIAVRAPHVAMVKGARSTSGFDALCNPFENRAFHIAPVQRDVTRDVFRGFIPFVSREERRSAEVTAKYALARRRASLASDAKQENEFLCSRSLLSSTMIGRSKFLEIMDTKHVNTLPGPELPRSRTNSP